MSAGVRSGLITGASRGIGRTIAFRLAQNGFGLTVTSCKADDLAVLAAELGKAGAPEVWFRAADMADRAALAAIADLHAQHFGALDALVLSAGVGTSGTISTYPISRHRYVGLGQGHDTRRQHDPSRRYSVRRRVDLVAEPEDIDHEDPDVAQRDVRLLCLIGARHRDGARVRTPLAARLSPRPEMAAAGSQGMVE